MTIRWFKFLGMGFTLAIAAVEQLSEDQLYVKAAAGLGALTLGSFGLFFINDALKKLAERRSYEARIARKKALWTEPYPECYCEPNHGGFPGCSSRNCKDPQNCCDPDPTPDEYEEWLRSTGRRNWREVFEKWLDNNIKNFRQTT